MAQNRTCIVCGTNYKYCNSCANANKEPAWKRIYCSEGCKEIAEIVNDLKGNKINKSSARIKLSKFRNKSLINFYADIVNEINYVEPVKFEESIELEIPVVETSSIVEESIEEEKPRFNNKRKNRKNDSIDEIVNEEINE